MNVTEEAVEAKGPIQIKGVPAELAWQRIFYASDDRQPPIKVTATLDEGAREKLGFKVNHLVKGPTPVTMSITGLGQGTAPAMSLTADLTNARAAVRQHGLDQARRPHAPTSSSTWRSRRTARPTCRTSRSSATTSISKAVSRSTPSSTSRASISPISRSISITHVEITATVRDDKVLDIKANGPTYDGKQFFRSLFSAGQFTDDGSTEPADPFGVDLAADIDTVVGFYDTTARNVHVTFKKRNGRIVALDAKGDLNGKTPAAVTLETSGGTREIKAEARDAGAAFRLIGFYPNVDGGEASARSQSRCRWTWDEERDALGARLYRARRRGGERRAHRSELASRAWSAQAGSSRAARIDFKQLRAPFSVGGGKFRLQDAYMNGAQLGATMRGTVDFKAQTVDLGGTYVPLYGLNSAFRAIPILGPVLGGRQGEGLVGITFAIKGSLDDPSVLVNPMSVMTPGIFRQIFEFTGTVPDAAAASHRQAAAEASPTRRNKLPRSIRAGSARGASCRARA